MTITGDGYLVRNSLSFRSDAKGVFYKQIDAMTSARMKFVEYFKEMEAQGFLSHEEEYAFIICDGVEDLSLSETLSQDLSYFTWICMRRSAFEEIQ